MKTIYLLCIISSFINGVFGEVKSVSVMEGDSVTLHTDTKLQSNDLIAWTFKDVNDPIATLDRADNKISYGTDGRFKDRLKLSAHTGDLTITNITTQHFGDYQLDINRDIVITKKFNVIGVRNPESDQLKSVSVKDGDSVTLHTDVFYINKYDEILWRFQRIPIAKFNKSASDLLEEKKFSDKLQPDVQTGSLQIKNIRTNLSGLYEVDLTTTSSGYTIHQSFTVAVNGEVKPVSVWKGYPVTINTDVPDIKTYYQILLIFGCDDRIAEANKQNKQFTLEKRFRERMKLNDQTGDFTIKDIRNEDAGDYELKMSSSRRTIQRRFRVNVGLSPAAIAKAVGISIGIPVIILLLIAAAGGVVIFDRRNDETQEVDEWKSVDLKTEVTDIKRDDLIEWRFGFRETLIAEINPANNIFSTYDGDDGLFRDKLNLNHKTGDLTIKSITWKHNGDYILKIIRDGETSYRRFRVSFYNTQLNVGEGKSADLKTEVKDIKKDDVIEWTFGKTIIAKINPVNNIFNTYKGGDDLFRGKLKLNHQTGDLNIKEIRQKHTGVYILKIIRDGKTSDKRFFVSIKDNVETLQVDEEKSVTLKTEVTDIQRVDLIEWRFGETLIAKINPANNIFRKFYGDYGEFRYKLKLICQTGDLNINDIRWQQDGVYLLKIIRDGETSYKRFSVSVRYTILTVYEGKSADLKTKVTDIKRDDVIEWRFKETLIAQINPVNNIFSTYDGDDDLFRDKLKLNHQTGDLNINDIRLEHTGVYELKITRDGETSDRRLFVSVTEKTKELKVNKGKSVDLKTEVKDIKRGDLIEWRFRKNLIAQINPANKSPITYDDAFRGKLKLKPQTGDLTINDIREEHSGVYLLKITRGGKISYMRFKVSVMDNLETLEVDEGKSVDLKAEVNIHYVDLIEWRFEKTLIAEINPANKIFSTYDGDDDEFRDKLKLNHQTGDLNISDIRWEHDGVYKLKIIRGGKPSYRSFEVIVRSSRGEDSVEKRGGDSVEKRGGDSVGIEMDPLLNNSSQ